MMYLGTDILLPALKKIFVLHNLFVLMKLLVANRTTFVLRVLNATIVEVAVNKSMPVQVVPVSTTEQIIKIYEVMMQPVIIVERTVGLFTWVTYVKTRELILRSSVYMEE